MAYREFLPDPSLRPYIDAYWIVEGGNSQPSIHRIYPDGCIDIIIDLCKDRAYLVGTMTHYKDTIRKPGMFFLGIRFKPLGFPSFYKFHSLHEIKDNTIDFDRKLAPQVPVFDENTIAILDKFFFDKLNTHPRRLHPLIAEMTLRKGNFSIDDIAKQFFVTTRQLERNFKSYIGISPKEFANFLRFQNAADLIAKNSGKKDLLDIALSAGYYDHAHMTNEIRRYTGVSPSQL